MVPRARIAVYKTIYTSVGTMADVVAAIDEVVQDGVKVRRPSAIPPPPPRPPNQIVIQTSSLFLSCFSKQFIHHCPEKEEKEVIIIELDNDIFILFHNFDFCQSCSLSSEIWLELNFFCLNWN
ncbi:hypothetical protein RYX36_029391 [Vicia faba]